MPIHIFWRYCRSGSHTRQRDECAESGRLTRRVSHVAPTHLVTCTRTVVHTPHTSHNHKSHMLTLTHRAQSDQCLSLHARLRALSGSLTWAHVKPGSQCRVLDGAPHGVTELHVLGVTMLHVLVHAACRSCRGSAVAAREWRGERSARGEQESHAPVAGLDRRSTAGPRRSAGRRPCCWRCRRPWRAPPRAPPPRAAPRRSDAARCRSPRRASSR